MQWLPGQRCTYYGTKMPGLMPGLLSGRAAIRSPIRALERALRLLSAAIKAKGYNSSAMVSASGHAFINTKLFNQKTKKYSNEKTDIYIVFCLLFPRGFRAGHGCEHHRGFGQCIVYD